MSTISISNLISGSYQGIQGLQGVQGLQGLGIQGVQGTQGIGSAGVQGTQGLQGLGIQGTQGLQGVQGIGSPGVQGTQGLQGLGIQGIQGIQGVQGTGFLNIPAVGNQTSSYTLTTSDVGKFVQVDTGGSVIIPNDTFTTGDIITIVNNTAGSITITCSINTAYITGLNTDYSSMTLLTRGVASVLFTEANTCFVTGSVL